METPARNLSCARCGKGLECQLDADGCWCADCLALFREGEPPPTNEGLIEGKDYYLDHGNFVFTKSYLDERGECCGNGCRNCPWS